MQHAETICFAGKLHVTLVNCVWGPKTCGSQVTILELVGFFARAILQCTIITNTQKCSRIVSAPIAQSVLNGVETKLHCNCMIK